MLEFLSNLWNMLRRGSNLQYEWLKAVCLFWEFTFVTLTSSLLKCHLYIYSIHVVEEAAKAEVATWVLSYLWVNAVSKGRQQKPSSPGHTQGQANYKCAGLETKRWDMWALASSYTCICVFIPQCIPRRPLIKAQSPCDKEQLKNAPSNLPYLLHLYGYSRQKKTKRKVRSAS